MPVARLTHLLRSRRLATGLIAVVSLWAVVASSVAEWRVSFGSPPFLALALLLAAATGACAWERSERASGWRRRLGMGQAHEVAVSAENAERVLCGMGLRVRRVGDASVAQRRLNVVARWASPVFHVALALGIVLGVAGSVFHQEAPVVVVSGVPLEIRVGPARVKLELKDIRENLRVAGVDRGQSPRIQATAPGGRVADAWVFPNKPLRAAGLTLHAVDSGPAVRVSVTGPDGSAVETDVPLVAGVGSGGEYGARLGVAGSGMLVVTRSMDRKVNVELGMADESTASGVLGEGESRKLGEAFEIRVVSTATWASLRAVWAPVDAWLALAALIACAGAGVALLYPARYVLVERVGDRCVLRVMSARIDPTFTRRVLQRLSEGRVEA